jgi:hypothetical protein
MSPLREAVVLPVIFLTVALCGGFRAATTVKLVAPTLTSLVLAVPLLALLVRSGVVPVMTLLSGLRTPLENVSGAVVLAALFGASAQALNLLIPDTGLLHAAFAIFVFCQLLTMGAATVNRPATLRGLLVLFGSLFVLRYILVEALYARDGGLMQRVLTTLMSGASLGGISYEPNAPVTGYMAFFTLVLYFVGLLLLPQPPVVALVRRQPSDSTALRSTVAVMLLVCLAGATACRQAPEVTKEGTATGKPPGAVAAAPLTPEQRAAALRAARVWQPPAVPISRAVLDANPSGPDSLNPKAVVDCRLVIKSMSGTTPKFDCDLAGHGVIRVKYGRGNPELHAEIAATRLLTALGFGADHMYTVGKVRCAGCPLFPFQALKCFGETGFENACFGGAIDYSSTTEFEHVSIERRLEGRRLESTPDQGWAFYEIDKVDPAAGGSPRAHVEAMKLLAVVIAHWDNKAENQRLLCLPGGDRPDGGCSRPYAILQDLGASFGPNKLDLHNWRSTPVWADARTCRVSMKQMPWGGATFPEQQISEEGRLFLLSLLEQLSSAQLRDLFAGARVDLSEGITGEARQPAAWAAAFLEKVRQIREAGPCGSNKSQAPSSKSQPLPTPKSQGDAQLPTRQP